MLKLELVGVRERDVVGEAIEPTGVYLNCGEEALARVFWWRRSMRVVAPGPGPVLPCGISEELTIVGAGERYERVEPLMRTPGGDGCEAGAKV